MERTPFLTGDRVELYPIEEDDLPRLRDIVNHEEVWPWISINQPQNLRHEEQFLTELTENEAQTTLLIYDVNEERRVGTVELLQEEPDDRRAELGIMLDPDHHSSGIGTEAVQLAVAYGFKERNLHKIWCRVAAHNEKSIGLFEKLGFTEEGRLREHVYAHGAYRDFVLYGMLRAEWQDD